MISIAFFLRWPMPLFLYAIRYKLDGVVRAPRFPQYVPLHFPVPCRRFCDVDNYHVAEHILFNEFLLYLMQGDDHVLGFSVCAEPYNASCIKSSSVERYTSGYFSYYREKRDLTVVAAISSISFLEDGD